MTPIQEWYSGRSILVTGGTGFMGKILLEKLIRALPELCKVYVLVRPKKGLTPEERIAAITLLPVRLIVLYTLVYFTSHNNRQRMYRDDTKTGSRGFCAIELLL